MTYETKADALEASFEGVTMPGARPVLGASGGEAQAFSDGFIRRGTLHGAGVEVKAMSTTTPGDGGVAVPREIDERIEVMIKAASPIRRIAQVVKVGSSGYRKLVTGTVTSGWATETQARPDTGSPAFNEVAPPMGDLYANVAASQAMLDDAAFDVEGWLAGEIASEFARAEGEAFVRGNGNGRPRGFINNSAALADGSRGFGTVQHIMSGTAGSLGPNPIDKLLDLMHLVKARYRANSHWVMNGRTLGVVRKLKTSDGGFLLQPRLTEAAPDRLLGFPVLEAEDMPDIADTATPIAFGDFHAGYIIAERTETVLLRDPYTNKPFVNFYATKRIGGSVANSDAIKLLKIGV